MDAHGAATEEGQSKKRRDMRETRERIKQGGRKETRKKKGT
jgi:hypothetical protein